MDKHVLIVSRSDDIASQIGDRLDESIAESGQELLIDYAKNRSEADRRVDTAPYDVVVSDVELPRDRQSSLVAGQRLGLGLLKDLRARDVRIPVVLLSTASDASLQQEIRRQTRAEYLALDNPDWDESLVEKCGKFITKKSSEDQLKLELDIVLHPANRYTYRMRVVGQPGLEEQGPLDMSLETLEKLGRSSSKVLVNEDDEWEMDLRDIGETLGKEIFQSNYQFSKKFFEFLGRVGGRKNANIRFVIEKHAHPIMLEALKEAGERYWMLDAPIYRRVKEPTNRFALFQDPETRAGPINCLIIEADIGNAMVPELGKKLGPLENVPIEVGELCEFLGRPENKERFHIGEVRVLKEGEGQTTFKDLVRNTLAEGKWHIVHYAGHSYFDKRQQTGYVFFPGQRIAAVKAEEFANWLNDSDVRFLYLSSCHSSEEDFVFSLANNMVPAIVGFRWDIEDRMAAEYTRCFYSQLFEKKSLEYAFLEARRQMHARHREHPIWASPVLVVQAKKE